MKYLLLKSDVNFAKCDEASGKKMSAVLGTASCASVDGCRARDRWRPPDTSRSVARLNMLNVQTIIINCSYLFVSQYNFFYQ